MTTTPRGHAANKFSYSGAPMIETNLNATGKAGVVMAGLTSVCNGSA